MSRTLTLVIVGLVLSGIVAVALYLNARSGVPVQAAVVGRGEIREFVDERGKTRLPVTYRITMPFAERIQQIDLPEGSRVRVGQELAAIAPADLRNELDEAQAVVDRLAASITQNDDATVEEVAYMQARQLELSMQRTTEAAEERKKSGQQRVDFAQKTLQRTEELLGPGARSQEQLDQARLSYVESQVNYRTDVLVWQAMQAIEAATGFLPRMVRDYISRKQLARAVLEKQQREAEARLRQAQLRYERSVMTSPIDGVVLERHVVNEQFLAAGTVLLTLGRLEDLEVEAEILSQDVVKIDVGDDVEIYGPAVGRQLGQGVPGAVSKIYPGGFTKISSLGVEQQRVKVVIYFAEGQLSELLQRDLGVDFTVRVRVFTATRSDALLVPRPAIFRGADGGWQVFAVRQGRARLQPIEVGLMNDDRVEIQAGLQADDLVVLAPDSSLVDGSRVRPIVRESLGRGGDREQGN